MLLLSGNTGFEEMANITIFSLNIVENSVKIPGKVLYIVVLLTKTVRAVRENIKPRSCCIDLARPRFDIFPYSPNSRGQ